MTQTYLGWDDNEYPWPPPDGWYQSADGKWWPEGYGPGAADAAAPVAAPPMENPAAFQAPAPAAAAPPPAAGPPPAAPFSAPGAPAPGMDPMGMQAPGAQAPGMDPPGMQVPPVTSGDSGGSGNKILLILGGLFALLLVAGGGIFALTRGGDDDAGPIVTTSASTDTTSSEGDATTAPTTAADAGGEPDATTAPPAGGGGAGSFENPHAFGDAVTITFEDFEGVSRSWIVEVLEPARDATQDIMDENQFNDPPPSGEVFAVAKIKITYQDGPAPGSVSELNLKAVGPSAVVLTWFGNYCGVVPDNLETSAELFPGGSTEGNICWSTDSGDIGSLTMLVDTFVADGEIYISLQ